MLTNEPEDVIRAVLPRLLVYERVRHTLRLIRKAVEADRDMASKEEEC